MASYAGVGKCLPEFAAIGTAWTIAKGLGMSTTEMPGVMSNTCASGHSELRPEALPDQHLLQLVRAGNVRFYAELYRRHQASARRVALWVSDATRADDLVAESFTAVLCTLLDGRGPHSGFRNYLLATVRNTQANTRRVTRREVLVGDAVPRGAELVCFDDPDGRYDATAITRAFRTLAPRWQKVLWLSVIEARTHGEIAEMLGISPNAVAALSFRAREGLRQAYLAEHLGKCGPCRPARESLAAYVRGNLGIRRSRLVQNHLTSCAECRATAADLTEVNSVFDAS